LEFLVTNFEIGPREEIVDRLETVSVSEDWDMTVRDYGGFRLFVNGGLLAAAKSDFAFDGTAIVDGRMVTLFRNYDKRSLRALREAVWARPADVCGCFCLVSVNKAQKRFILQYDVLNAYPSFVYRSGDQYVVSNNIHFIEAAAEAAGRTLTRTALPYLSDFALGSAYDVGSPYREVEILRPGQTVRGGADGLKITDDAAGRQDAASDASYEDALQHAGERLRARVALVAETFEQPDVFFDLTGGMDSRMVLAAVVSRNPRPAWDFRTLFDPPHPDGHCAALFGETFGLGRVKGIPADERRLFSPFDRMRFETFISMGVGAKQGWTITPAYQDIAHIHGGYGEIAGSSPDGKRFLSQDGPLTYRSLLESYITRLGTLGILKFFVPEGVEWLRSLMASRLGQYETAGIAPEDAPLHYYNGGRLRSHFGVISRLRSQNRNYIDILYDMHLQSCALKVAPKQRIAGKVNFDLIRLLGGDAVAGLPMANARWDPSLFAGGAAPQELRAPPITATTPNTFREVPEKRVFEPAVSGREVSFSSRPDPNLPPYDITRVDRAHRDTFRRQLFLSTYLPDLRSASELQPILDWAQIDAVLAAPPETLTRYPFDLLLQALCDITIWHRKMELSVYR